MLGAEEVTAALLLSRQLQQYHYGHLPLGFGHDQGIG